MTTALREQAAGRNIEPLVEPPQPRFPTSKPYRLVSREGHPESTIVDVAGIPVGGEEFVVMAGPCCVEGEESIEQVGRRVFEAVVAVASGERTAAERWGHREFSIGRIAPTF